MSEGDDKSFLIALGLDENADEKAVRKAYARNLKSVDTQADPIAFQNLRNAYESALAWLTAPKDEDWGVQWEDDEDPWDTPEPITARVEGEPDDLPDLDHPWQKARKHFDRLLEALTRLTEEAKAEDVHGLLQTSLDHPDMVSFEAHAHFESMLVDALIEDTIPHSGPLRDAAAQRFGWVAPQSGEDDEEPGREETGDLDPVDDEAQAKNAARLAWKFGLEYHAAKEAILLTVSFFTKMYLPPYDGRIAILLVAAGLIMSLLGAWVGRWVGMQARKNLFRRWVLDGLKEGAATIGIGFILMGGALELVALHPGGWWAQQTRILPVFDGWRISLTMLVSLIHIMQFRELAFRD